MNTNTEIDNQAQEQEQQNHNQNSDYEAELESGNDGANLENSENQNNSANSEEEQAAWMREENQEGEGSADLKFSDKDVAGLRRKLQAKVKAKDEELAKLQAEVEQLKATRLGAQHNSSQQSTIPTLEQFDHDEQLYAQAMENWIAQSVSKLTQKQTEVQKTEEFKRSFENSVNQHYERAAKLVKEHNIEPELYHDAGLNLRREIEKVFPGSGDVVTERMLSVLGEGSEKVEYHLGRNAQKREILKAKLLEDPSGLSASVYLGKILAEVSDIPKRKTNAPAPAARAIGGNGSSLNDEAALRKSFEAAGDDVQKALEIKYKARKLGFDTKKW